MSSVPAIVLVEDNPADVSLLRLCLAEQGTPFRLLVLTTGEQAIDYFREQAILNQPTPCVILLDLHLPRGNGVEVLEEIAREPRLAHVNVAVWSTLATPEEQAKAEKLGVDFYTNKPTTLEGFLELAIRLLEICNGKAVEIVV